MIMKMRNANVGEMVTKVSPTVKALKKKRGEIGKCLHCLSG